MRRRGLTVVEFLIVLAMVFTGVGLAVVVSQAIWKVNQRVGTANNLKDCALAVHAFHDEYRKLPDAFYPGGGKPDQPRSLWLHLVPFVGPTMAPKEGQTRAVVPAFLAPNDPSLRDPAGKLSFAGNLRLFAHNTFGAVRCNDLKAPLTLPPSGAPMSANLTLPRIVDGTSNVMMLAARYANCSGKPTEYAAHPAEYGGFIGAGLHAKPPSRDRGDPDLMFQIAPDVNARSPYACNPLPGVYGHSFDAGGFPIALADGTVKSIGVSMRTVTFMKVVCPGDNPFTASDWVED